ncbi:MAG: CDP-alcohol phosphatidyltransferase family protein [bacterium]
MLSQYFKGKIDPLFKYLIMPLPDNKSIPTILSLIGLFLSLITGILFAFDFIRIGGIFILLAGLFDILDGVHARINGRTSSFGAFIDSTSDRYSDMFILSGLGILYAQKFALAYLVLTFITMIGFVMVSYTKARVESIISKCDVGIMERPERVIVLAIGALTLQINVCLWILAILTHFTVLQRIWYTYQNTEVKEREVKEVF